MSAFRRGEPELLRRTSVSTFIDSSRNESELGTVTHAVSACERRELSSPAAAG